MTLDEVAANTIAIIQDAKAKMLADGMSADRADFVIGTALGVDMEEKENDDMIPDDETAAGEIHPAPVEFSEEAIQLDPILRFFHYAHLPPALQARSQPFCALAMHLVETTPRNAERSVALRKLLEAKDAAVRASV